MSPLAPQPETWTQTPPWQFVEQHSLGAAQALPRVVQLEIVVATTAQAPAVQIPEQHWAAPLQETPVDLQAAAAQVPDWQESAQQSFEDVQACPASAQNAEEVHFPAEHTVEQHSDPEAQVSPPTLQAQVRSAPQAPEQHWPGFVALQVAPRARHWLTGSVQRPFTHAFVQQFASEPQTWLTARHVDGWTQVPVQAELQHSLGVAQAAPSALHVGAGPHVPPALHWPVQHSDAALQSAPSLLHESAAPQKPLGQDPEQHSEAATQAVPSTRHEEERLELEQPEAAIATSAMASATAR